MAVNILPHLRFCRDYRSFNPSLCHLSPFLLPYVATLAGPPIWQQLPRPGGPLQ